MAILREIERFLKLSGMAPTRFGRNAVRDPRLVHDLRNGRQPGPDMSARVRRYLDERTEV